MASPPRPMARQAMGRRVLGSQSAGPFISTQLGGRMRGCSRQSATLALPAYHGTERSRANAPSVKEKETPCVAAAGRVAISVNSLSARREWAGLQRAIYRCARHGGRPCWHACSLGAMRDDGASHASRDGGRAPATASRSSGAVGARKRRRCPSNAAANHALPCLADGK